MSATEAKPDVIVTWMAPEYGQWGRASDGVARGLVANGLARRVVYIEPVETQGPPNLTCTARDGLDVYQLIGRPNIGLLVGRAVVENSHLEDPILLNFGLSENNWWFHHAFAPWCARTALVTHDILHLRAGLDDLTRDVLLRARLGMAEASDMVFGLSEGAIRDIPGAIYLGHGVDPGLELVGDLPPEPPELRNVPHPRAVYFGALCVRIDELAFRLLADAGVHVVLVGNAPTPGLTQLINTHHNVHFLGPRPPMESPAYLRHCDIGIVPHTDEPFTWTMEPHKVYNYAAAGLRSVLLNCACPPALAPDAVTTSTPQEFAKAVLESLEAGPLSRQRAEAARQRTWAEVGRKILGHMDSHEYDRNVVTV